MPRSVYLGRVYSSYWALYTLPTKAGTLQTWSAFPCTTIRLYHADFNELIFAILLERVHVRHLLISYKAYP